MAADVKPAVRALWVQAFTEGLKTPEQIDQLVAAAHKAYLNTIIAQVRRRADAYFISTVEPRTEDPQVTPGFDPLGYLIDRAHAHGIEVLAWGPLYPAWHWPEYPQNPTHPWNLHGPKTAGRADWSTYTYDGQPTYCFDPGHPDVPEHLTAAFMEILRRYPVDGIHLDYIRYDERGYGYNPTALQRFQTQTGQSGRPTLMDPEWRAWRRQQVTQMLRRLYIESRAVRPDAKVTAAVITWDSPPRDEGAWKDSSPYCRADQDWHAWLEEGILDSIYPMNYFREYRPDHQAWFADWLEFEKDHQYQRQVVPGIGGFLNYREDVITQLQQVLAPSKRGNEAAGFALYCWNQITAEQVMPDPVEEAILPRKPHPFDPCARPHFFEELARYLGQAAPVPPMPWKSCPDVGHIAGQLRGHDSVLVEAEGVITRQAVTDSSGWFGFANLPPGTYEVRIGDMQRRVTVEAGRVVRF